MNRDRTVLYSNIEPIGLGSGYVESLSSYILRLADAHAVPPAKLLELIYSMVETDNGKAHFLKSSTVSFLINKSNETVIVLELLTGRKDLRFLTPLCWKYIYRSKQFFNVHKKWCPCCLNEWRENSSQIYEPLQWSFAHVNYCLHHKHKLEINCPKCHKKQPCISSRMKLGYCFNCHCWLGEYQENEITSIEIDDMKMCENNLELLSLMFTLNYCPLQSRLINNIKSIKESLKLTNNELAELFGVSGSAVSKWFRDIDQFPSYKSYFIFCARFNLSIYDVFIRGEFKELEKLYSAISSNRYCIKNRDRTVNKAELERLLIDNLGQIKPLPIRELGREFNVWPVTIKKLFPELYKKHIYNSKEKDVRLEKCINELKDLIDNPKLFLKGYSFYSVVKKYQIRPNYIKKHYADLQQAVVQGKNTMQNEIKKNLEECLGKIIKEGLYLDLSLKEMMKREGYSIYAAKKHFPNLSSIILNRNKAYRDELICQKRREIDSKN